jgi:hypothetical protein
MAGEGDDAGVAIRRLREDVDAAVCWRELPGGGSPENIGQDLTRGVAALRVRRTLLQSCRPRVLGRLAGYD